MKRQPPFQWPPATNPAAGTHNDDPDAPYVNGNPSAGIEGSIPPAEVFDHPQKEIVNVITHAGLTPAHNDLTQLRQAISKMIDTEVDNENIGGGVGPFIDNAAGKYRFRKLKAGTNVNLSVDTDGAILIDATPGAGGPGAPDVTSGLGVDVNGDNELDLAYQTLPASGAVVGADQFAYRRESNGLHYALTFSQLIGLVSGAGRLLSVRWFENNATFVKTVGATKALVFATGGGSGASGGVSAYPGGGAGATAIDFVDISAIDNIAITIGLGGVGGTNGAGQSGGQTSFGAFAVAAGGIAAAFGTNMDIALPGEGGLATAGLIRLPGGDGTVNGYYGAGSGGGSFWGGGGRGGNRAPGGIGTFNGANGKAPGSAGGGGDGAGGGLGKGGDGAKGCVLVLEFS